MRSTSASAPVRRPHHPASITRAASSIIGAPSFQARIPGTCPAGASTAAPLDRTPQATVAEEVPQASFQSQVPQASTPAVEASVPQVGGSGIPQRMSDPPTDLNPDSAGHRTAPTEPGGDALATAGGGEARFRFDSAAAATARVGRLRRPAA
ncbi:hypothetical protein GCM10027408_09450 [Microbacterium tumbae]